MKGGRSHDAIRRIAEALGVPEHVLHEPSDEDTDLAIADASQISELLRLFSTIKDPTVRQACVEDVRLRAGIVAPSTGYPAVDRVRET